MSVDENILCFAKFLADHTKWIWEWRWRIHGKQWLLLSQHMHIPSKRRSLAKAAERCPVAFAHHFVSPAKYGYKHNTCHSIHRHSAQQLARERTADRNNYHTFPRVYRLTVYAQIRPNFYSPNRIFSPDFSLSPSGSSPEALLSGNRLSMYPLASGNINYRSDKSG